MIRRLTIAALVLVWILGIAIVVVAQAPPAVRTVNNVAELRALNPIPFAAPGNRAAVRTLGYYEPGDGGGEEFYLSTEAGDDNGGTIIDSNWSGRRWKTSKWSGNPKAFGARGDGITDDTAALRLATAAAIQTVNRLHFPAGRYRVISSGTPVITISTNGFVLTGDGAEKSVIVDEGTGVVVQLGDGVNFHQRNVIEKIRIDGGANTVALIKAASQSCYNTIRDVFLFGGKRGVDASAWSWGYTLDQVDITFSEIGIIQGDVNPHWQYYASKIRYCSDVGFLATNQFAANRPFMQTWHSGTISHSRRGIILADAREFRFQSLYLEDCGGDDNGPSVILNSLSRGNSFDRPMIMLQRGDGFEVGGLGNEINHPVFFSIPSGTRGIYLTPSAAFCSVITDKYGTWSRGSGGSITAVAGTGDLNGLRREDFSIVNGGAGYSTNTAAYITSASGGFGNRGRISLQISDAGVITNLVVLDPGSAYSSAPTVIINDWDEVLVDTGFRSQINGVTIDRTAQAGDQPQLSPQAGLVLNNADHTLWYVDRSGQARSLRPTRPSRDDLEDFGASNNRWRYINAREFFAYGYGQVPSITFRRANGSSSDADPVLNADALGGVYWSGATNDVPDWISARSAVVSWAGADWTPLSNPTYMSFEVTDSNQVDRREVLRITEAGNMNWTGSAPVLNVNPTNNGSGLRINFPAAHGNNDILRLQKNGLTFFVADQNGAAATAGLEIWYSGALRQVGVTNINGATVLHLPGVTPP